MGLTPVVLRKYSSLIKTLNRDFGTSFYCRVINCLIYNRCALTFDTHGGQIVASVGSATPTKGSDES